MKEWIFDKIKVCESEYDGDLHCFKVYNGDDFLGNIFPNTIEDMQDCIKALDNGEDPISCSWEDGLGHLCNINGWGTEE